MRCNEREIREQMGCGYEPPIADPLSVWRPPSGYQGPDPTFCIGYTANLPEVNEATQAYAHWSNGAIASFCGGDPATEDLLQGVLILDEARKSVDAWRLTPVEEGGGRR